MEKAENVMENFMKKLDDSEFEKETLPDDGPDMNDVFVNERTNAYKQMLGSGVIDEVLND